jgi:hypothetical protein
LASSQTAILSIVRIERRQDMSARLSTNLSFHGIKTVEKAEALNQTRTGARQVSFDIEGETWEHGVGRIVLYLHDDADLEEAATQFESLAEQIRKLR